MKGSGSVLRKAATASATLLALALAGWLLRGGARELGRRLEGPEAGIRRALARVAPATPIGLGADGATLRLTRLRFADPLVTELDGRSRVVAVADADGVVAWRGREVAVSSLGRETLAMARCAEGWCVDGVELPRLAALLGTLVRRAGAFDGADAGAYGSLVSGDYRGSEGGRGELLRRLSADLGATPRARLRPLSWQIRIERETALVGEEYELAVGEGPPRRLRARFDLREEGGRWAFTGGL